MVKNCSQESSFNISNRIFSTGWFAILDIFWLRTIYIKRSVLRAHVCLPRWPTAFKMWFVKFWNFRRFSFMNMYRYKSYYPWLIRSILGEVFYYVMFFGKTVLNKDALQLLPQKCPICYLQPEQWYLDMPNFHWHSSLFSQ